MPVTWKLGLTGLALALAPAVAPAATVSERYSFDAKLVAGTLFCGRAVGEERSCANQFGGMGKPDELPFGMAIGRSYPGRIDLRYDTRGTGPEPELSDARCSLDQRNCFFGRDFFNVSQVPMGPMPGRMDFSSTEAAFASTFEIDGATGSYEFGTDYQTDRATGRIHYYDNLRFDLTDIRYSTDIAPVPLPGALPLLLSAIALGVGRSVMTRRRG